MSYMPTVSTSTLDFPEPSKYDATTSTFVNAGRNAQGITVGAVVREDVAKIVMQWNFLEPTEWAQILQQFSSKYGGSFYREITFLNQDTNNWETRTFYVSDRTAGLYRRDSVSGQVIGYTNPKLSLIEA